MKTTARAWYRECRRWLTIAWSRPLARADIARCVVLAPHPDDESLGCGGTIARKRAAGTDVTIVIASDGETSDRQNRPRQVVAQARRQEAVAAAARLGVDEHEVVFLGLPDGSLEANFDELVDRVAEIVARVEPEQVLVCAGADGHPDHVALNRASRAAVATRGVEVLEYLVWAWVTWPSSLGRTPTPPTNRDRVGPIRPSLSRERIAHVRLGRHRIAKRAAVACYQSQFGSGRPGEGLPKEMLALFDAPFEVFLRP